MVKGMVEPLEEKIGMELSEGKSTSSRVGNNGTEQNEFVSSSTWAEKMDIGSSLTTHMENLNNRPTGVVSSPARNPVHL